MTTETDDRITTLLTDARAALDDLGIRETADESDADDGDEARPLELTTDLEDGAEDGLPEPISSTDLPSLAEEAHELVEEGDVQSLLERVGLDTLPDGSTPSSLPEAIANGDPGQVATLRALQRLASFADPDSDSDLDDADSLEETVLDLYGLLTKSVAVETGDEEASEGDADASDGADEPDEGEMDEDEMDEEGEADQKDEDETDESEESTSESDTEPAEVTDETDEADETDGDGDLEDSISSALKDAVGGFGDEVESLKAGLEAAGLGDDEEADAEVEADTEGEEADGDDANEERDEIESDRDDDSDTDDEDGVEEDEADDEAGVEEDEADEDDRLLNTGDDTPLGGSRSGRRRGTMYSTVARSPSKRSDMKATTRHSTMPKRN